MFGRHAHREPRQSAAIHVMTGMQGERQKRRRMSDSGHLRLAILESIGECARDAQGVIEALTARCGGCYGPSPGFVYPMLSLLEDQGYVAADEPDGTRRRYTITPAGRRYLDENQPFLNAISVERSASAPALRDALDRLKHALVRRARPDGDDAARLEKMQEILTRAAREIEAL